jgi:hypothetical protein
VRRGGAPGRAEFARDVQTKGVFGGAIFSLAAAVTAAALVDPMTEWIANKGLFGPRNFTDHINLDVVPALVIGLAFAIAFVLALVRRTMSPTARYAPDWLRRFAGANRARSALRLLPAIFVLQLLMLWSMETSEQLVVFGRPLGGMIWLGGPVFTSLLLHAAGCVVVTWLLSKAVRWSAETIVEVVRLVRHILRDVAADPAATRSYVEIACTAPKKPILARLSGRAPPYLIA